MSESTGGSGPALAAHSKDASAPGQNPASLATGEARPSGEARRSNEGGEAVSRALQQATDFVRGQPLVAMAGFVVAGIIARKLLSRR
jgi:hypothetical protein